MEFRELPREANYQCTGLGYSATAARGAGAKQLGPTGQAFTRTSAQTHMRTRTSALPTHRSRACWKEGGRAKVVTMERGDDVLAAAARNEASAELFMHVAITQLCGDAVELLAGLPDGTFGAAMHDPPHDPPHDPLQLMHMCTRGSYTHAILL